MMKPIIRISDGAKKFSSLLDGTLPVLASAKREAALNIVAAGCNEAISPLTRRSDEPRAEALTIELGHGETCALEYINSRKIRLHYAPSQLGAAMAALLAAGVGSNAPISGDNQTHALLTLTERLGSSDIPVLIGGPSGTGKEVFARYLHNSSERAGEPFVAVNCAAMPEAMLEALLFGHKKGAFTGASEAAEGLFRAADKGTLLLDEIGELPLALQAKLLRTLQEGEVLPLGATKPVPIDVRIVACTNRELALEVEEGRFREDLFYRLSVFPMRLPALRDRPDDLAPLAFGMLLRHGCRHGLPSWISAAALARLSRHPWPGNVRELENVIRRAILLAHDTTVIEPEHIQFDSAVRAVHEDERVPLMPVANTSDRGAPSLSDVARQSEAQAILDALEQCNGHRGNTAKQLGISERTLRYRLASMREDGVVEAGAAR
jgi:two-component system response regulator FlrC